MREIRCQHLHLIRGNHGKNWDMADGFESVSDYKELETDEGKVILFHYPIECWSGVRKGAIHIHGHIHGTMEENLHNVEIGLHRWEARMDANEYKPVFLDDIVAMFK